MEALGRELRRAGLNELALAELFGPAASGDDVPLVLSRYRGDDPRAALLRVFVLGERMARDSLPVAAEGLAEAGLIELDGDTVSPRVGLTPVCGDADRARSAHVGRRRGHGGQRRFPHAGDA